MSILLPLVFLFAPAAVIYLCIKFSTLNKLGPVPLTFGAGFLLSLIPAGSIDFQVVSITTEELKGGIAQLSIALAIPLLVFSFNLKECVETSKSMMKAFVIAVFSVSFVSLVGALLFSDVLSYPSETAGLAVGAYTGGGANMAAVKAAVDANNELFITMVTYDMALSGLYLLFMIALGERVFGLFLPKQVHSDGAHGDLENTETASSISVDESTEAYANIVAGGRRKESLLALGFTVLVLAISLLISTLLPESIQSTGVVVLISSIGVIFSFVPFIRKLANSFPLGMYCVLVFCAASGSMVSISGLLDMDTGILTYILFIMGGSLVLHATLSRLFGIDLDTFLMTSCAAVMSAPFVPVMATALKNKFILVPGLAVAIIGYVIGRYLGILVALATRWLL